ncbi:tripartite tricarboxylate transporter TctB family protein [Bosea sp. 117]|uniref:tripartite tricarboxylate transporter TctB family protein n=1 Tax=Bosea sp. 117 TaxID=1125973 RepID=UPI0004944EA5|nr:tripartite tricarboxylate transporter TctB family protein [Bosea sp. 117]
MPLRDLLTGGIVAVFGAVLLLFGNHLSPGTAVRMGPGFVPRAVAIGLLLVAAGIIARGLVSYPARRADQPAEAPIQWRGAASIGIGILAFAALIQPVGLIASAMVTVFVSSLAQQGEGLPERVVLAGGLAGVAGLVFSVALGLPLPMLPTLS